MIEVPPILEDRPNVRKALAQYVTAVRRTDDKFTGMLAALKAGCQNTSTILVFFPDNERHFLALLEGDGVQVRHMAADAPVARFQLRRRG